MLLGQRGQQQEMVVRRIGSCYIVLHSRTYIEIEGAHRLFAISRHILHVFYFCAVVFFCLLCRLILIKEFTSMSTSTAPLISFLLFERLKRRETYRRSPFVFVVSFVTRSLIPYGYIYTLDSLVYLVLYYPG